ncbi:MAG: undecaprenyl-diphosphate phosphatase, partial [Lachnospiraceae bacterium]|nr:undecaprenyl-diphosphate phosphatase [Lachnospiraceae bacterium]
MLEFLKVIVLGIVEGITEWLPISSTGHMILVEEFIRLNVSEEFMEMFLVVIQLGAILAVVVLYFPKLWPLCSPKNGWIKKDTWILWFKVMVAALPAAVIGLLLDDAIDEIFYNYVTVAAMLIIYGVLFILVENHRPKPRFKSLDTLPWSIAFGIGVFQVLALIPGPSRSGATILGGNLLGTTRGVEAEFSFFLSIP